MVEKRNKVFITQHFHAVLFRRWVMIKRSWKTLTISSLGTIIFSALAIIAYYLMVTLMVSDKKPYTFKTFEFDSPYYVAVDQSSKDLGDMIVYNTLTDMMKKVYHNDTGEDMKLIPFDNLSAANAYMYEIAPNITDDIEYINFGFSYNGRIPARIPGLPIPGFQSYNITLMYNETQSRSLRIAQINLFRVIWKMVFGEDKDLDFSYIRLYLQIKQLAFGQLGPMLIAAGLCSIIPLIISQPITDINGEVRPYMISCTLSILPYWLATFLIDFCIWIIDVTFIWIIFLACQIQAFIDNALSTWYGLVLGGPAFIIFLYCLSFLFSSADSASRQAFMIMSILLLVPMIVDIVRNFKDPPIWLDIVYGFFPHIAIQRILTNVLSNMGFLTKSLAEWFKDEHCRIYLIMEYTNIVLYGIILWIIESVRLYTQKKLAQHSFGNFTEFFKDQKAKHPVTDEAHHMEDLVNDKNNKFAVRIHNCSRLFFNTAGEPIPAVNCVSLGVKEGSLFGFLGANGAGKTTLIKMITGLLPPSDGTIEINGVDTDEYYDPTLLSICPQFNTHLCDEMTPAEHFKLYSLLFQMTKEEAQENTDRLIKLLEIEELKDKPIRDLSAGDVRKLAIALCFLGPAKIILLDEPTAPLDPVARKHVHEMIMSFKGEKTFMLCTHLLSEAESLCDEISIMIKGNVYTVGSPQYLSQRFGTEFKIDISLKDGSQDDVDKVNKFFQEKIPQAELSIMRPRARIYSVPASSTTLSGLFDTMQEGKNGDNGFDYYTCSSSSLERVFMEIVHMSECEDLVVVQKDGKDSKDTRRSSAAGESQSKLFNVDASDSSSSKDPPTL